MKTEWEEAIYKCLPGYLRYYEHSSSVRYMDDLYEAYTGRYSGPKMRDYRCSVCGMRFAVEGGALLKARHGDRERCPCCDTKCTVINERMMRNNASINGHERFLIAERVGKDYVKLRAYYVEYTFTDEDPRPQLWEHEDAIYNLKPGEVFAQRCEAYSGRWIDCGIREPWPVVDAYTHVLHGYTFIADELEGTFLGYLPLDEMMNRSWATEYSGYYGNCYRDAQTPWAKILCTEALYPSLEYAMKLGAWDFVVDLVMKRVKNARLVDWSAKKPHKFLRAKPEEARILIDAGCPKNAMKLMKRYGIGAEEAIAWTAKHYDAEDIDRTAKEIGDEPVGLVRYLMRQGLSRDGLRHMKDYREAAAYIGRDLSVPTIRWPKEFVAAHDEATKSRDAMIMEVKEHGYKELHDRLARRFEFYGDEYEAIVPERLSDIKLEGKLQHHCVGGYIDRHVKGQCVIMFVRSLMRPLMPLYTVELTPSGNIVQIQGYHNEQKNKPHGAAQDFINEWMIEIARRLAIRKEAEA